MSCSELSQSKGDVTFVDPILHLQIGLELLLDKEGKTPGRVLRVSKKKKKESDVLFCSEISQ